MLLFFSPFEPNSIESDESGLLNEFYLEQNYPNPFNPTTKIKFSITDVGTGPALFSLKVYDILGNEVAILVNEHKAAGKYEIEFNTTETHNGVSLPSGVYFYKLQSGSFISVRKMILMK